MFSGLERVSEKRRGKKEKIASDETPASPVLEKASTNVISDENQSETVLSDLKDMVSDLSQSFSEREAPVSETQKEAPVIKPNHQATQAPIAAPKTAGIDSRVKAILPPWMEKAWRWVSPDDPELLEVELEVGTREKRVVCGVVVGDGMRGRDRHFHLVQIWIDGYRRYPDAQSLAEAEFDVGSQVEELPVQPGQGAYGLRKIIEVRSLEDEVVLEDQHVLQLALLRMMDGREVAERASVHLLPTGNLAFVAA